MAEQAEQQVATESEEQQGDPPLEDAGKKALASERRARAAAEKQAKELKARLDEFEAQQLSAQEKAVKDAEAAKAEAQAARREALRWRYRPDGMSDEDVELYLTGGDEATIQRQAERYQQLFTAAQPGKGTHVPGVGNKPAAPPSLAEQINAAQQSGDHELVMSLKTQQLIEAARRQ